LPPTVCPAVSIRLKSLFSYAAKENHSAYPWGYWRQLGCF